MSNLTYEFETFFEPADAELPIRKLFVTAYLHVEESDEQPGRYTCGVESFEVRDAAGLSVTNEFHFLVPKLLSEFHELHLTKAIDRYTGGIV